MIRQLFDALRLSVLHFFDVSWQAVVLMLALVAALVGVAYFRTTSSMFGPASVLQHACGFAALVLLYLVGRTIRR